MQYLKIYIERGRYRLIPFNQIEYFNKHSTTRLKYIGEQQANSAGLTTMGVADGWYFVNNEESSGMDANLQLQLVDDPIVDQIYCYATVWNDEGMKNISFLEGYIVNDRGETIEVIK